MSLKSHIWERRYKTSSDSNFLISEFKRPALEKSITHFRGAGYFSSSAFNSIGATLGDFVKRNGKIWMITNVEYSKEDKEAVEKGLTNWGSIVEEKIDEIIENDFSSRMANGSIILTRLLEIGSLRLKIGLIPGGIYHEKIGIFFDSEVEIDSKLEDLAENNFLAYSGSINESVSGWRKNYERISVWPSWIESRRDDAVDTLSDFLELWNGENEALEVMDFSEAAKKKLIQIRKTKEKEEISVNGSDNGK